MKSVLFGILFSVSLFAQSSTPVKTTVLSELDSHEPFEAHLFHDGYLWVGRSRKGLASYYRLEVYEPSGKQVANLELQHSITYLSPYGEDGVLAIGVSASPNITQYTIVKAQNGRFTPDNHPVPETAWATRFVGKPGLMLFTDPGGNQDDSELQAHPHLSAQTLFRLDSGQPQYLKTRLAGPQAGVVLGDSLYVIQNKDLFGQQANLARVDLKTEQVEILLPTYHHNLNDLLVLQDGKLALSEEGADQVLIYDPASRRLTTTIKVAAGTPRSLAQIGHCLAVGSEHSRQVSFYDLSANDPGLISQWDLTSAGDKLMGARRIAADPQSGRIYARSAYPCFAFGNCPADRNSVVMAEEPSGATFQQCSK